MSIINCTCGCNGATEEHKVVACCICKNAFKYSCVDLTITEIRTLKTKKGCSWSCTNCAALGSDINELKATILGLRNEIQSLKGESFSDALFEEVLQEMEDRHDRKQNIIIFNYPESASGDSEARKAYDTAAAKSILSAVSTSVNSDGIETYRLGRFNSNNVRPRPLKIRLGCVRDMRTIMKHAKRIRDSNFKNISISPDRTLRQLNYYKRVRAEMDTRKANGETDLRIKYQRGIPTIQALN